MLDFREVLFDIPELVSHLVEQGLEQFAEGGRSGRLQLGGNIFEGLDVERFGEKRFNAVSMPVPSGLSRRTFLCDRKVLDDRVTRLWPLTSPQPRTRPRRGRTWPPVRSVLNACRSSGPRPHRRRGEHCVTRDHRPYATAASVADRPGCQWLNRSMSHCTAVGLSRRSPVACPAAPSCGSSGGVSRCATVTSAPAPRQAFSKA